jgi:phage terminase small subunit
LPALSNPKHERFAQELAKGKTADEAYQEAGYKANRGNAATLKAKQNIQDRVTEILNRAATRVEITQARVLEELAKIGFSNMLDYTAITSDGDPYVDLSKMSRDQAAAVQQIVVEDYKDGRGEDARDVRKVTFKLADKRAALVDIGKHLGMFKEVHELSGPDKGPIQTQEVSPVAKLADRIAGIAAARAARKDPG